MEILTRAQVGQMAYKDELCIPGDFAEITRSDKVLPPDIGQILTIEGFTGLGLEEHLSAIAEAGDLRLVGGTARMIEGVDIQIPRVFPMFGVPESLREATGLQMPYILEETRQAY